MNPQTFHEFARMLESTRKRIAASRMPKRNKEILYRFDDHLALAGLTPARRLKLLSLAYVFATRYLTKPFERASLDDINAAIVRIETSAYAPWTKHDYKVTVRKLFKFVIWGQEALRRRDYPECVASIPTRVARRDRVRIQAADILTEGEVNRLLAATTDTQNRALYSLMYELGARVGEVGSMRVGSVTRDPYSYVCDLNGKTGPRSVRVILSAGILTSWLNLHPRGDDPAAPLWGCLVSGEWRQLRYGLIQRRLQALAAQAQIKKRVHPHLLRHTRITHVLAQGLLNEAQAKVFFGLVQQSEALGTYSHLLSSDANDAILRMYGVQKQGSPEPAKPTTCGMCGATNEAAIRFCARCGYALSSDAGQNAEARTRAAGQRIAQLLDRPGIAEELRKIIQSEIAAALSQSLPEQSPPPLRPRPEQHPDARAQLTVD